MKSVTLRDHKGELLFKIVHRKNGVCDVIKHHSYYGIDIEVRDDQNCKIIFREEESKK